MRAMRSTTVPMKRRFRPVIPRLPATIRSIGWFLQYSVATSAGSPGDDLKLPGDAQRWHELLDCGAALRLARLKIAAAFEFDGWMELVRWQMDRVQQAQFRACKLGKAGRPFDHRLRGVGEIDHTEDGADDRVWEPMPILLNGLVLYLL